jgi:hypothetical protein
MRRNLAITTAIALALALVVTNFTLAAGSDHRQTIQLTATGFADQDVDVDPPG